MYGLVIVEQASESARQRGLHARDARRLRHDIVLEVGSVSMHPSIPKISKGMQLHGTREHSQNTPLARNALRHHVLPDIAVVYADPLLVRPDLMVRFLDAEDNVALVGGEVGEGLG